MKAGNVEKWMLVFSPEKEANVVRASILIVYGV